MKNKTFFVSVLIKILVIVVFSIFLYLNIFQKLDYRLYDALIHLRKNPKNTEKIVLVNIDDLSIQALGEWPWSRDVIADTLIRMKECGADTAIFDIEYISPSKNGIAPSAEEKIRTSINSTQRDINELLNQLSNAIQSGYYSIRELPELTKVLQDENIPNTFFELNDYINNNMARDNDEYFARALQFFGKAYLTVNHQNLGYAITKEEIEYVKNRMLKANVTDKGFLINIGNNITLEESEESKGFTPALNKLLTRAYGVNFTNSVIDSDGVRRRIELIHNYDNKYDLQLSFGPFLQIVDSYDLLRQKDELIVKNALNPINGKREDISIPLDPHGRMLINFRRGAADDAFNHCSIIQIIDLDLSETAMIECLKNITIQKMFDENGYELVPLTHAKQIIQQYYEIQDYKDYLLDMCEGYNEDGSLINGITEDDYKSYFDARNAFYNEIKSFINADYLSIFKNKLESERNEMNSEDIDIVLSYMEEDFGNLKSNYDYFENNLKDLKKLFDKSYCILGNTATSTTDNGATPFEKKYVNVAIHANILNTLLTQQFIYTIRLIWGFAGAIVLALLMLFLNKLSNAKQNVISFICYFIYCAIWGGMFVFSKYYIQFIGTIFYLASDLILGIGYRFYQSTKEKQFITQIAASFANKDTVEELRKNPDAFKTEGQKKCITALFSDIQKFSTLSESIGKMYGDEGPNKLIEILNEYLGKMSNEILRNSGNIDKYEGDAIISMFGAPDPMNTHTKEEWAYLCLDSAIRMKKVEVEFNNMHSDMFKPIEIINSEGKSEIIQLKPLQTRIGVNSGDAFVGLMGSKTDSFSKLNYTMIGDTVNLASRLEGVNKAYNSWIMCSDSTWKMANVGVHKDEILARRLDKVRVVGRSTPVQLYNIIGFTNEVDKDVKEQIEIFHAALDKYLNKDFKNAGKLFMQANKIGEGDPTSIVFADRCKNFIQNGVPEDWDGVINMTSK